METDKSPPSEAESAEEMRTRLLGKTAMPVSEKAFLSMEGNLWLWRDKTHFHREEVKT